MIYIWCYVIIVTIYWDVYSNYTTNILADIQVCLNIWYDWYDIQVWFHIWTYRKVLCLLLHGQFKTLRAWWLISKFWTNQIDMGQHWTKSTIDFGYDLVQAGPPRSLSWFRTPISSVYRAITQLSGWWFGTILIPRGDIVYVITPINILFRGGGKFWTLMKIKLMLLPQSTYCS